MSIHSERANLFMSILSCQDDLSGPPSDSSRIGKITIGEPMKYKTAYTAPNTVLTFLKK